jgi:S1-C subfamily serine protease
MTFAINSLLISIATAFSLFVPLFSAAAENPLPADDASIVEVIATCQNYDTRMPWRKQKPRIFPGLGVVVDKNKVLTTADLVRNQTLVEIRRAKSGTKIKVEVVESDFQANIALLAICSSNASQDLKSVVIADKVQRNDKVTIVKMDETGQFQSDEGQVMEINSTPGGLILKVLTDLSIERNGTPVFRDGKLAGISTFYDKSTRSCLAISAATLKLFFAGVNTPPYPGLAWAGFRWEPLLDPAKKKYLGADGNSSGVLVVNTIPGSGAAAALLPEDVILEWDGNRLDELGYYNDPEYGRLLFTYLINGRHKPGENAAVTVLRGGKKQTVSVPLKHQIDLEQTVPQNLEGAQAEYLADGGMILRELSGDYLMAAGTHWLMQANPRLLYYYLNPWQFSGKVGEHVVILSFVLPDQINIGYHELHDEIVTAINGKPVTNLAGVFDAVEKDGGLKSITLKAGGVDVVLDEKEMPVANKRIAANYRLPNLRFQRMQTDEKHLR